MVPRDDPAERWITPRIPTSLAVLDRLHEWEWLSNWGPPLGVAHPPEPTRAALQDRSFEHLRESFDAERRRAETMTAELRAAQAERSEAFIGPRALQRAAQRQVERALERAGYGPELVREPGQLMVPYDEYVDDSALNSGTEEEEAVELRAAQPERLEAPWSDFDERRAAQRQAERAAERAGHGPEVVRGLLVFHDDPFMLLESSDDEDDEYVDDSALNSGTDDIEGYQQVSRIGEVNVVAFVDDLVPALGRPVVDCTVIFPFDAGACLIPEGRTVGYVEGHAEPQCRLCPQHRHLYLQPSTCDLDVLHIPVYSSSCA